MRKYAERLAHAGSDYANSVLGTEWGSKADRWLRDFVDAKPTAASKAMDAEYLRTHVGGGWHRLFDGGHDLYGAFKATRAAGDYASCMHHLGVYVHELWKDLATPNGLPVITWNKSTFDALVHVLKTYLHVDSTWVHKMACINATNIGGATAAVAAMLLNMKSSDPKRYFELCGSLGVSAIAQLNIVLVAAWILFLVMGCRKRRSTLRIWDGLAVSRGVIISVTVMLTVALLGRFGLAVAIPLAFGVRKLLRYVEEWIEQGWTIKAAVAMQYEVTRALLPPPAPMFLLSAPKPAI